MTTITLMPAELATVLAALRYWQREGLMSAGVERDIADDCGTLDPLDSGRIDALCERINTTPAPRIAVILEGGMVQAVVTDTPALVGSRIMVIDYDTDGADEDDLFAVPTHQSEREDAMCRSFDIEPASIMLHAVQDHLDAA